LLFVSIGLFAYQLSNQKLVQEVHLPSDFKGQSGGRAPDFSGFLSIPARFTDHLIKKANMPLESLKKRLLSAGGKLNASQFFAIKLLLIVSLLFLAFIFFPAQPNFFILALGIGFVLPDLWLKNKIKQRQAEVLRHLPHVIDLLNICVSAGLDFMVAVNRVIQEFRPCVLIDEFKEMMHEIQMGSSRRDAMKKLSNRINSPEVISFVRTLLQADRMGTPISEALKMQSEEIRIRRFQQGEEMALKAPIKLLAPLLIFILPVVLIIVAGPIMIQFTRGGFMKF
ncbi:MAG: type II secretion system F family protein, partial [Candidatus Omnitrophota bacterium]